LLDGFDAGELERPNGGDVIVGQLPLELSAIRATRVGGLGQQQRLAIEIRGSRVADGCQPMRRRGDDAARLAEQPL
jgi:hypothetical protein